MIAQGPVVRHQLTADPILVQSTRVTNPEQKAPIDVPQYKRSQEPMLPSVSASITSYNYGAITLLSLVITR